MAKRHKLEYLTPYDQIATQEVWPVWDYRATESSNLPTCATPHLEALQHFPHHSIVTLLWNIWTQHKLS